MNTRTDLRPYASAVPHTEIAHPVADPQNGASTLDLRALLALVRRNAIWIAAIVFATVLAGLVISLLLVPQYTSRATVLVEQREQQIIENGDSEPVSSPFDTQTFLNTQAEVIKSRSLALRVVDNENLTKDPAFYEAMGTEPPADASTMVLRQNAAQLVQDSIAVGYLEESRLVSIEVTTRSPELSARLANSIAQNFIESNLARKFESSTYAREYLTQQLDDARTQLAESERNLNRYARLAGLIRSPSEGAGESEAAGLSITSAGLVEVNTARSQAIANRIAAEKQWQNVASKPVLALPQVLSNPAIVELQSRKSALEAQLAQERVRKLDDHPTVVALRDQISQVESQIQSLGSSIKQSIRVNYETAVDNERALNGVVDDLRGQALDEQDKSVQYNILKRVAETNRAQYDMLLERFNELNAAAGSTANNLSLLDVAEARNLPSFPNIPLNLVAAFFLGLVFASIFVFVREFLDDRIREPDQVESKLGITLLGVVPKVPDNVEPIEELSDAKNSISEAYGVVVTNLRFLTESGVPEVLSITSSSKGEGKSLTSLAIARQLAQMGRRVIIIDADLRRPNVHTTTGLGRDKLGLPSVLVGEASLDDVTHYVEEHELYAVSGLPIPPEPTVLLGGTKLPQVIAEAREKFDHVIVDCPPLMGLSDAPLVTRQTDATIMVMSAQDQSVRGVKLALQRLNLVGTNMAGLVMTKFDPRQSATNYDYYAEYYAYEA